MRSASAAVVGVLLLVLGTSQVAAEEKDPAADPERAPHQNAQSPTARPHLPPARRGRWGGAVGLRQFNGTATFDYRNAPTPLAGASGPYTGAVITVENKWTGKFFSGGYRAPFHAAGKGGYGVEMQLSGAGKDLPDQQVVGRSPSGAQVLFSTDQGGIVDLITVAVAGHASLNVTSSISLWAGAKVAYFRVKAQSGSYRTAGPFPFPAFLKEDATTVWVHSVIPTAGVESIFSDHLSVEVAADLQPDKTEQVAATPVAMTFRRHGVALTASLRVFF